LSAARVEAPPAGVLDLHLADQLRPQAVPGGLALAGPAVGPGLAVLAGLERPDHLEPLTRALGREAGRVPDVAQLAVLVVEGQDQGGDGAAGLAFAPADRDRGGACRPSCAPRQPIATASIVRCRRTFTMPTRSPGR